MSNKIITKFSNQQGQTLIETMVAVFIMVMGITAALGLAIYSFNATTLANKQVVAMGLAREGLEAVKNMRDTNWLKATSFDPGCNCYLDWRSSYYQIQPTPAKQQGYALDFNPLQAPYWTLDAVPLTYQLNYDPDASKGRFFYPDSTGTPNSDYYRRIAIYEDASAPYDSDSPRLEVTADVWWRDRKCPDVPEFEQSTPSCRVSLKTYLTNWKNY